MPFRFNPCRPCCQEVCDDPLVIQVSYGYVGGTFIHPNTALALDADNVPSFVGEVTGYGNPATTSHLNWSQTIAGGTITDTYTVRPQAFLKDNFGASSGSHTYIVSLHYFWQQGQAYGGAFSLTVTWAGKVIAQGNYSGVREIQASPPQNDANWPLTVVFQLTGNTRQPCDVTTIVPQCCFGLNLPFTLHATLIQTQGDKACNCFSGLTIPLTAVSNNQWQGIQDLGPFCGTGPIQLVFNCNGSPQTCNCFSLVVMGCNHSVGVVQSCSISPFLASFTMGTPGCCNSFLPDSSWTCHVSL